MSTEMSFADWYTQVKAAYLQNGLTLPDDMELMELAHMECMSDGISIEAFVQQSIAEQQRNQ